MEEFFKSVLFNRIVESAVVIIISVLIYRAYIKIINLGRKKNVLKNKVDNKKITYIRLMSSVIKYALIMVSVLIVLQINGVNVNSLLAGIGIVGVVVGLALQDALKDIIMGANIITDSFFSVGDVVKYKEIEGKVLVLGLKTTKIQDISNKNIISISNRNINEIVNVSNVLDIKIPAPYEVELEKIEGVLQQVARQIKEMDHVKNSEYGGIIKFDESYILYGIRIYCSPEYKLGIKGKTLNIIKMMFDKNEIKMPYQQIDVHTK